MKKMILLFALGLRGLSAQSPVRMPVAIDSGCATVTVTPFDGGYGHYLRIRLVSACTGRYTFTIGMKYIADGVRVAETRDDSLIVMRSVDPGETVQEEVLSDWQDYTNVQPVVCVREVVASAN